MLVMERIHPLDFRAYEVEIRQLWLNVFEDECKNNFIGQGLYTVILNDPLILKAWPSIIFY